MSLLSTERGEVMKVEFDEVCQSCKGTGLYQGMAERNGAAVVCHTCEGTGCLHFKHEYEIFQGRREKDGVRRVFEVNLGIGLGEGNGHKLSEFGGMPYRDWKAGRPFPKGSENRRYTCPAWWYQSANYKLKPEWKECTFGAFSSCPSFKNKEACWKRWEESS